MVPLNAALSRHLPRAPRPRHLLTAGVTDNGNYLFWITEPESDPDVWRIAINEARGHDWYTFDGTLTMKARAEGTP